MYPKKEKKNHNHESKRSIRPSIQANFNNKLLSSTFSQHPVRVKATPHNVLHEEDTITRYTSACTTNTIVSHCMAHDHSYFSEKF